MADYPLINAGTSTIDTSLGELNDVNVQNASDNQVLTFVAGASPSAKWQATNVSRDNWMVANKGLDFTTSPTATGNDGIAIGRDTHSSGYKSLAIGDNALSSGTNAAAAGYKAKANGNYSLALGTTATASAHNSIAIGSGFDLTSSTADSSISIGRAATADNVDSKIILLTDNAGIRVRPNGDVQTTSDGGITWTTISSSVNFPPQANPGNRFDKDTDIGCPVYFDGTEWKKAQADDPFTIATAIVDWIGNTGFYTIKNVGVVRDIKNEVNEDGPGNSLIPGDYYYLSTTQAGKVTTLRPSDNEIVAPLWQALTTTSALVLPYRAGGKPGTSGTVFSPTIPPFDPVNDMGCLVYFNGTEWNKARADDSMTIGIGVVNKIETNGAFTVSNSGMVQGIRPSINGGDPLTPGSYYYLSTTAFGEITKIKPTTTGHFVVPVYLAITTDSAMILPFRADKV